MVFQGLVLGLLQHQPVSKLDHSGTLMVSSRWVHAAVQEKYQTTQVLYPEAIYSVLRKDL